MFVPLLHTGPLPPHPSSAPWSANGWTASVSSDVAPSRLLRCFIIWHWMEGGTLMTMCIHK
eukprot:10018865-Ditylum_brightwellii.AAC.1